jgi:YegS/Rv2252/BmrU family lipid kinase
MTDPVHIPADKWLIIVNPNAGVGKGGRDWQGISHLLNAVNINHLCVLTEHRVHANLITREFIGEGYRNIAVVGGDGTMNEVVNGIFTQDFCDPLEITVGMIPVGSGNDWCRTFGIPFEYKKAVEILVKKETTLQDVGTVIYFRKEEQHSRYFVNIAGMGYDALVAKKTNLQKDKGKGGPLVYLYFVFASLFQFRFPDAVITVDEKEVFNGDIFSMNVGICKFNGGGMMQVPFAVPDDGLLDVTLIRKTSKFMVIRHTTKLYDGTLVNLPFVSTYRGTSINMVSSKKIYLEVDGESLGHTPFSFGIIPRALKVVRG